MLTHIVDHLLDFLLFAFWANEKHIAGIGHDIIVDAGHHGELVAGHKEYVAGTSIRENIAVLGHVVVAVFRRIVVKRAPSAEVVPSEIHTFHKHIVGFFHNGVVNRHARTIGEMGFDIFVFTRGAEEVGSALKCGTEIGRKPVNGLNYG